MARLIDSSTPTRTTAHKNSIGEEVPNIVRKLVSVIGAPAVADIVKKDVRTVQRWAGAKPTRIGFDDEKVLRDIYQVYAILADGDGDHTIRAWFLGMNPLLDDRSPIEVLVEGKARHVVAAARSYASGG